MASISRKLRFVAWTGASKRKPFDRLAAAATVKAIPNDEVIFEENEALSAVEAVEVGSTTDPTCFALLALRDYDNRPLGWGPGTLPKPIRIAKGTYTADLAYVVMWADNVAAIEMYPNSPGLGRLQRYLSNMAGQRVMFRSLYQPDLVERLKDLKSLRGVELGVYEPEKAKALAGTGLSSLVPPAFGPKVPSFHVSGGVGRHGGPDASFDKELSDEIIRLAQKADEYFDSLKITGKSKSQVSAAGNALTVTINLVNERIQVEQTFPGAQGGGNTPDRGRVVARFNAARKTLGKVLEDAVEARIASIPDVEEDE
ncbi:MAG TPA: hypothetical protein VJP39_01140 [Gaiellaceae bacterium]|nr:hypothetical protein [Gaiellaceae bacterium]